MKVPRQITNHVIDIVNLSRNFNNIQFNYCKRSQNFLAGRIAKRSHRTCHINEVCFSKKKKKNRTFI